MFKLKSSLQTWSTSDFTQTFFDEVTALDTNLLPLQQGLSHSSFANGDRLSVMLLNKKSSKEKLFVKAGLFYTGIISGCNCSDNPAPADENNEYCEVLFCIDRITANTVVTLTD